MSYVHESKATTTASSILIGLMLNSLQVYFNAPQNKYLGLWVSTWCLCVSFFRNICGQLCKNKICICIYICLQLMNAKLQHIKAINYLIFSSSWDLEETVLNDPVLYIWHMLVSLQRIKNTALLFTVPYYSDGSRGVYGDTNLLCTDLSTE